MRARRGLDEIVNLLREERTLREQQRWLIEGAPTSVAPEAAQLAKHVAEALQLDEGRNQAAHSHDEGRNQTAHSHDEGRNQAALQLDELSDLRNDEEHDILQSVAISGNQ